MRELSNLMGPFDTPSVVSAQSDAVAVIDRLSNVLLSLCPIPHISDVKLTSCLDTFRISNLNNFLFFFKKSKSILKLTTGQRVFETELPRSDEFSTDYNLSTDKGIKFLS